MSPSTMCGPPPDRSHGRFCDISVHRVAIGPVYGFLRAPPSFARADVAVNVSACSCMSSCFCVCLCASMHVFFFSDAASHYICLCLSVFMCCLLAFVSACYFRRHSIAINVQAEQLFMSLTRSLIIKTCWSLCSVSYHTGLRCVL